jgi:hypothetical protein
MWMFDPFAVEPDEPESAGHDPDLRSGERRRCEPYLPDTRSTHMTKITRSALSGGGCVSGSP